MGPTQVESLFIAAGHSALGLTPSNAKKSEQPRRDLAAHDSSSHSQSHPPAESLATPAVISHKAEQTLQLISKQTNRNSGPTKESVT